MAEPSATPPKLTTPGYLHRGLDDLFAMARAAPLTPPCEQFYFIRHGETDGNHKRIFQPAEIPLNARGMAQAEAASKALATARLERIVASTMNRAWTKTDDLILFLYRKPTTIFYRFTTSFCWSGWPITFGYF